MDSGRNTLAGGFPHSEIFGSMRICPLPEAFRRLSRLSSPVVAKAFTVCACSLDPITRTLVGRRWRIESGDSILPLGGLARYVTLPTRDHSRASLRTFHIVKEQVGLDTSQATSAQAETQNHLRAPHEQGFRSTAGLPFRQGLIRMALGLRSVLGRGGGARRVRTADPRLAKPMLSRLSYGPTSGGPGWTRTTDLTLIRGAL